MRHFRHQNLDESGGKVSGLGFMVMDDEGPSLCSGTCLMSMNVIETFCDTLEALWQIDPRAEIWPGLETGEDNLGKTVAVRC